MSYHCNITDEKFNLAECDKHRECGLFNNYNCRQRAVIHVLSKCLYNKILNFKEFPKNDDIKGIGLSGSTWCDFLKEKLNYTSTYYFKEPVINVYDKISLLKYHNSDFIIASEFMEHVDPYPGISIVFKNLYNILKPNGHIIISVPYRIDAKHTEHYPSLYKYDIKTDDNNQKYIDNRNKQNKKENFYDLTFHDEEEKSLEMRIFSEESIKKYLFNCGFKDITFHKIDKNMERNGIFWDPKNQNKWSLVVTGKK